MSDWELDSVDNDEPGINAELDNAQTQEEKSRKMQSIYKLPPLIFDLHKKAYQPHAVSLGPYHHGETHLKPMEVYKQRALLNFLRRLQVSLSKIIVSMVEVAQELKGSYALLEPEWQDDTEKFVKLMIVDGCFMLSIFWSAKLSVDDEYFVDDPLFGDHNIQFFMPLFKRNVLLLEN